MFVKTIKIKKKKIPVCGKLVSYILVIRDNKIIEQDIRSHGPEFQANSSLQANNKHEE